MKCIHCKKPNPERWFICRNCGKQASEPKFTTNMYMMSEIGKRTDIEFRTTSLEEGKAAAKKYKKNMKRKKK